MPDEILAQQILNPKSGAHLVTPTGSAAIADDDILETISNFVVHTTSHQPGELQFAGSFIIREGGNWPRAYLTQEATKARSSLSEWYGDLCEFNEGISSEAAHDQSTGEVRSEHLREQQEIYSRIEAARAYLPEKLITQLRQRFEYLFAPDDGEQVRISPGSVRKSTRVDSGSTRRSTSISSRQRRRQWRWAGRRSKRTRPTSGTRGSPSRTPYRSSPDPRRTYRVRSSRSTRSRGT